MGGREDLQPVGVDGGILFRYQDSRARSVSIAGEFNGWRMDLHPLSKSDKDLWETIIPLREGIYQYRYVVDGRWIDDPANPWRVDNGYGGANSVIDVDDLGRVLITLDSVRPRLMHNRPSVESPEWVQDAIIYEIFPRVFSKEGTLNAITRKLPDISSLGVNCIWLMPIHKIGLAGRKGILGSPYSIYDYFSIDPAYGSKEDLRDLVRAAHDLGIRVIMDFVANHTSNDSVLTTQHPEWFCRDCHGNIQRAGFGWDDVSQLNYFDNPELEDYMIQVGKYWIGDFDVDGFRCDVAALVPVQFWVKFRNEIKKIKSDAMLLAESHEPIHNLLAFDVTYEEELPRILEDVVKGRKGANAIPEGLVQQEREFPRGSLRLRYLENHDLPRSANRFGFAPLGAAALLLFTLDGIPLIYNGQEIGELERPSLFDPSLIGWDRPYREGIRNRLKGLYGALCALRKSHASLRRGRLSFVEAMGEKKPEAAVAFVRVQGQALIQGRSRAQGLDPGATLDRDHGVIVVLNMCSEAQRVKISPDIVLRLAPDGKTGKILAREIFRVEAGAIFSTGGLCGSMDENLGAGNWHEISAGGEFALNLGAWSGVALAAQTY